MAFWHKVMARFCVSQLGARGSGAYAARDRLDRLIDDDASTLDVVVEALGGNPTAHMHAFMLLLARAERKDRGVRIAALKGITHRSAQVRAGAARLLGIGRYSDALDTLLRLMDDPSADVRVATLAAVGLLGDRRAVPVIQRLLADDASEVRAAGAEAIGLLRDPSAIQSVAALLNDPSDSVRAAAPAALEKLGDSRSLQGLMAALKESGDEEDRIRAVRSLGKLGTRGAEALLSAFDSESGQLVKAEIVRALGETRDPRSFGPAVKLLDDLEVLNVGVDVLVGLGRLEAIPALENCLANLHDKPYTKGDLSIPDLQAAKVEQGIRSLHAANDAFVNQPAEAAQPLVPAGSGEEQLRYEKVLLHDWYRIAVSAQADKNPVSRLDVANMLVHAEKQDYRIRYLSETGDLSLDGNSIQLTPLQTRLLRFVLMEHSPDTIVKNHEADEYVWNKQSHERNIRQLYSELGQRLFGNEWQEYFRSVAGGRKFKEGFTYLWIEASEEGTERPNR